MRRMAWMTSACAASTFTSLGTVKSMISSFASGYCFLKLLSGDDGKNIHAGAEEESLIVGKDADDFVNRAVEAHGLAERVAVGEQGLGNGGAKHDHGARVFLVKSANEAPLFDVEKRKRRSVFGFGAAHDDLFDGMVTADDAVGIAEEEAAGADGIHVFHVRSRGAKNFGIVISDCSGGREFCRACAQGSVPGGNRVRK